MAGRREERFPAALAIAMEGASGVARDVSASGIYFETDAELVEGSPLHFTVEFEDSPGRPLRLQCEARVVRVEKRGGKIGVGASIHSLKFEVLEGQQSQPER